MSVFCERLQELMAHRNISQRQLAIKTGVTEASMSRYVNGERIPRPETIANIATALNTTCDYLLGIDKAHDADYDFSNVVRIIARNASSLTDEQKKSIIDAVFAKE